MTVRTAELLMAIMMGAFSIYLMVKSAELPIGWIDEEGPGGGTWPFWLSTIMLISCSGILINWFSDGSSMPAVGILRQGGEPLLNNSLDRLAPLFSPIGIYGRNAIHF